jgi:hypothetical protein
MLLKRKDNFFLFTLIDFLLQTIFVGLFVFFLSIQNSEKGLPGSLIQKIKQAGVAQVAELIDTANKLVPLDRLQELVKILNEFKSLEEINSALEVSKKLGKEGLKDILNAPKEKLEKMLGNLRGTPPCFKNEKGAADYLFRIAGYDGYYKISDITKSGYEVIQKTGFAITENTQISPKELFELGSKAKSGYKDCANYVYYDAMTDKHSVWALVSNWFIPWKGKVAY